MKFFIFIMVIANLAIAVKTGIEWAEIRQMNRDSKATLRRANELYQAAIRLQQTNSATMDQAARLHHLFSLNINYADTFLDGFLKNSPTTMLFALERMRLVKDSATTILVSK